MPETQEEIFSFMFVIWICLAGLGFLLFGLNKNVRFKKMVWPMWIVGVGLLFAGFGYWMGFRGEVFFYMIVPATLIISILNILTVKFCDGCSKLLSN